MGRHLVKEGANFVHLYVQVIYTYIQLHFNKCPNGRSVSSTIKSEAYGACLAAGSSTASPSLEDTSSLLESVVESCSSFLGLRSRADVELD